MAMVPMVGPSPVQSRNEGCAPARRTPVNPGSPVFGVIRGVLPRHRRALVSALDVRLSPPVQSLGRLTALYVLEPQVTPA